MISFRIYYKLWAVSLCDTGFKPIIFRVKTYIFPPGTLAACCKPSSGAGVVWMVTPLRGWVRFPAMKEWRPPQGAPTKQPLYQGADQPGAGRTQVWGAALQVQPQIKRGQKLGAQGRGFEPRRRLFHSFTSKLAVMTTIRVVSPTQPWLRRTSMCIVAECYRCNHCNVADCIWLELYL